MKRILISAAVILLLALSLASAPEAGRGEDKIRWESIYQNMAPELGQAQQPSVVPALPSLQATPPVMTAMPSFVPPPRQGFMNPLTGLTAEKDIAGNRPCAIMINNISVAQPLLGISKADIIYEILTEGGITRLMAVYQDVSDVGRIGSIRSARPYFVDIALGYDAVYIHAGGSPDAYAELHRSGVTDLDGVNGSRQEIFYRDRERRKKMGYEHSMVTSGELIDKFLPKYGFRLRRQGGSACTMHFGDVARTDRDARADSVSVSFSRSKTTSFDYRPSEALYAVSQYGKAISDGDTHETLSVANILVLKTGIRVISNDEKGRIEVDTTGGGTGHFVSGGTCAPITWTRRHKNDQFSFTQGDGTSITFARGKTYVCIIDRDDAVEIK